MKTVFSIRPCTWVYLIMIGLTLVTWYIGRMAVGGLELSLLVLGFALFKGFMLGDYFMDLKGVRGFWRWPILIWLLIPGGLIALAFTQASGS